MDFLLSCVALVTRREDDSEAKTKYVFQKNKHMDAVSVLYFFC